MEAQEGEGTRGVPPAVQMGRQLLRPLWRECDALADSCRELMHIHGAALLAGWRVSG